MHSGGADIGGMTTLDTFAEWQVYGQMSIAVSSRQGLPAK